MLMDSVSRLSTSNIPTGKPIVVFFFSPSCPYCRAQTEDLIKNIQSLGDIRFYLLAQLPFAPVRKYYTHYQLEKYTNITLGLDYETYFGKYYKANAVPYIAIFNKEKQLKHVLVGNVGSKTIKEIAFE
jgi:protein-disulfide isomerase